MIRSTLGTFTAVFVIAITAIHSFAQPNPDVDLCDARLQFEVALQALERDERRLASDLLQELAATTGEAPERAVYDVLIARAEGHTADFEAGVEQVFAKSSSEQFSCPWVYDELVRLAAEIRLARLEAEADQRLEQVLARHYEARGGLDRLRSVEDLMAIGRMVIGEAELPFRLLRKRPRFYRLDLATPEGVRIMACDGQVSWRVDPARGDGKPEYLSGTQGTQLLQQSYFDDVLIRYRETGEKLFLAGTEVVNGREAYRIEIDIPRGDHHAIFLDTETLLEVQRLIWTDPNAPPVEMTFEHVDVDRRMMPARQTVRTADGSVEYIFDTYDLESVINVEIFDLGFAHRGGESQKTPEVPSL